MVRTRGATCTATKERSAIPEPRTLRSRWLWSHCPRSFDRPKVLQQPLLADQVLRTLVTGQQLVDEFLVDVYLFLSSIEEQTLTQKSKHPLLRGRRAHRMHVVSSQLRINYSYTDKCLSFSDSTQPPLWVIYSCR